MRNYDKLLTDKDLLKTLQLSFWSRSVIVNEEIEIVDAIENVIEGIEQELK